MARKRNVTREEIFAAADQIAAEEKGHVTLEGIRQKVGGSFTTLSPALRAWRAQQAAAAETPPAAPLPDPVRQQLDAVGAALWATVQSRAEERLQTERDTLQRERQDIEAGQAEVAEAADQQAQIADEFKERCTALEEKNRRLRAALAKAHEATARAEARASAQKLLADELREQLEATRRSLGADLLARIEELAQLVRERRAGSGSDQLRDRGSNQEHDNPRPSTGDG